jgi:hypothetical protein
MRAVLMAGGVPVEGEPLYPLTLGAPKAFLPVAGKPMAQSVLDALAEARRVEGVVVVGIEGGLFYPGEIEYVPNRGGMIENARAGAARLLELHRDARRVLFVSSDIPAARGPQIDWVIESAEASDEDLFYCVVARRDMEASFPGCRRTYYRFRGEEVCGGDLMIAATRLISSESPIWGRLEAARKSPLGTAAAIGPEVLVLFLLGLLTVDGAARLAGRRLGLRGRALRCPFPELGMDVDKPFQRDIVEDFMSRRGRT